MLLSTGFSIPPPLLLLLGRHYCDYTWCPVYRVATRVKPVKNNEEVHVFYECWNLKCSSNIFTVFPLFLIVTIYSLLGTVYKGNDFESGCLICPVYNKSEYSWVGK